MRRATPARRRFLTYGLCWFCLVPFIPSLEPKYTQIGLGLAFEPGTGKLILTEVFVQP